jgi:molybdopterin biosynthesis enzyme
MQYARVVVERGADGWIATPTGGRGSNLISTVARANGLAMVPAGTQTAPAGSQVQVMVFRTGED